MAFIVETNKRGEWKLVDAQGYGVNEGTTCTDFRGDSDVIVGGVPPAAAGKSGYVEIENGSHFYPSVYGASNPVHRRRRRNPISLGLRWILVDGEGV